jgi:succinyl-CoA synthetase alpha subunit
VIGASSTRQTLGNIALDNLAAYKFPGQIIPVHDTAREVGNLPAVQSIEALPTSVDVALASVPAAGVADVVRRLDRRGVPTVIVNTSGFSIQQETELRGLLNETCILMHGPNCMGVINFTNATPIYTGGITSRVQPGPVALIAQSGSAAISLINSSTAGFSKVITIGSEYQVTGSDYLHWLASDPATSVVGVVLESIPHPDRFADAVDRVQSCGKSVVVLKVGRSATGARRGGVERVGNDRFRARCCDRPRRFRRAHRCKYGVAALSQATDQRWSDGASGAGDHDSHSHSFGSEESTRAEFVSSALRCDFVITIGSAVACFARKRNEGWPFRTWN